VEFGVFAIIVAILLAVQPKPTTTVVLLPDDEGTVGRVLVTSEAGTREISSAYGAATVSDDGSISQHQESAESVREKHGELLAFMPKPARSYVLYFQPGSNELVPESLTTLEELKQDAAQRAELEVRVIGHTDTVGSDADNDELSARRAEAIAAKLVEWGIHARSVETTGRGERDLLVKTADNVDEARNRRVEVSIR